MNDALNHFNSKFLGQRKRCEAFELIVQSGGEKCLEEALALNDSPFYRFWFPLLRDGKAVLMHSVPIYRRSKKFDWPSDKEQDGIWHLQRAFEKMWEGQNPIEQLSSSTPHIEQQLYSSNIIITGSTASNVIARTYFEHFKGLRYGTNYFMPDYTDIHIYDRQKRKKIYSRYAKDDFGGVSPVRDYGILTVIKNPMDDTKFLIGCMGNHGFGTLGCLETISTSECLNALLKLIGFPLKGKGFQILVEHNIADHEAKIIKSSLHLIS